MRKLRRQCLRYGVFGVKEIWIDDRGREYEKQGTTLISQDEENLAYEFDKDMGVWMRTDVI
jgi:hypothetical protein